MALPRNIYLVVAILAALDSKITFLPIDLEQPRERILYMLDNAKIDYIFTVEEVEYDFGKYNTVCLDDSRFIGNLNRSSILKNDNEIAYILYTSGTTGAPKAVEVTRKGLNNFIEAIPEIIELKNGKRIACFTSSSFDIFFLEIILPIYRGMTVVLADEEEQNNPRSIMRILMEYSINVLQMTPSRLKMLKAVDANFESLKKLEVILVGGEKFPYEILKALQGNTNARIYNMYGPTETTIWSTVSELTNKDKIDLGHPIKGTMVYLLLDGKEVKKGCIGEICIGGVGLAKGYLRNEEQTERVFKYLPFGTNERVYYTGDLGVYDNDGNLLYMGRKDNQIKLRGHRIELEEIDSNLTKIQEIKIAATCFDNNREALIAFFVSDAVIKDADIREKLKDYLPSYMLPSMFLRVEKMLYTVSGKIDRKGLLKLYENIRLEDKGLGLNKISGEVCEIVIKVIREVLCDELLFINEKSEVVNLGIDSISFIRIIVELEKNLTLNFMMID